MKSENIFEQALKFSFPENIAIFDFSTPSPLKMTSKLADNSKKVTAFLEDMLMVKYVSHEI